MRDKWDRVTGDGTYGTITIRNAVLSSSEVYRPTGIARTSATEDFDVLEGTGRIGNASGTANPDLAEFSGLDIDAIQQERDRREREGYQFTPDYRFITTKMKTPYSAKKIGETSQKNQNQNKKQRLKLRQRQ